MKRFTFTCDDFTFALMQEIVKRNPPLYRNRSQLLRLAVQALHAKPKK